MAAVWIEPEWKDLPDAATLGGPIQDAPLVDAKYMRVSPQGTFLKWDSRLVFLGLRLQVPRVAKVTYKIEAGPGDASVGFDLQPVKGHVLLNNGSEVKALRVWDDRKFASEDTYSITSKGELGIWNVCMMKAPNGEMSESKWSHNAGMLAEVLSESSVRIHCSPGFAKVPNFEHLVVTITVAGELSAAGKSRPKQ